jgi:hypothetical protein
MRYLLAVAVIVALGASTAWAGWGCYAPAPVVVHAHYPVAPVYSYRPAVVYPSVAYYAPPVVHTGYYAAPVYRAAYYAPVARTWVGPLGRVRTRVYYRGW